MYALRPLGLYVTPCYRCPLGERVPLKSGVLAVSVLAAVATGGVARTPSTGFPAGFPDRLARATRTQTAPIRTAPIRTGPLFNDPVRGTTKQDVISSQVAKLITGTPKGALISIAMYHFS